MKGEKGDKEYIYIDDEDEVKINQNHIKKLKTRFNNCNKNILIIPLSITDNEQSGHANMLILNKFRKELEWFEPHGAISYLKYKHFKILENILKNIANELDLLYLAPSNVCPNIKGFQSYDTSNLKTKNNIKDPQGFCLAWSFFYAELRMKFPKLSSKDIIDKTIHIIGNKPLQYRKFIRGQANYINNYKLDNNKLTIKELQSRVLDYEKKSKSNSEEMKFLEDNLFDMYYNKFKDYKSKSSSNETDYSKSNHIPAPRPLLLAPIPKLRVTFYGKKTVKELKDIAKNKGLLDYNNLKKFDLIRYIIQSVTIIKPIPAPRTKLKKKQTPVPRTKLKKTSEEKPKLRRSDRIKAKKIQA